MLKFLFPLISMLMLGTKKNFFWQGGFLFSIYFLILSLSGFYSPLVKFLFSSNYFFMDVMSMSLISLSIWIFIVSILASWKIFLYSNKKKLFYFWSCLLLSILILSFGLSSALFFYFSFEMSLIPITMMILGWGYQPERLQASLYLILYTVCASLPLLMMLLKLFSLTFSVNFIFLAFQNNLNFISLNKIYWIMLILAFLVKMPMFLFHLWLPKAHVEAPVAGSMVLAGVLLKLGSFGFLRMAFIFPKMNISLFSMISSVCLWGAMITGFICLRQVDMKALIAYSSVGHMGLLLGGMLSGNYWGWTSSLMMMIAHGLCSSSLFMTVNIIYEKVHNRSLFLTKGILTLFPYLTLWWFLINIINMAAPPSINLASELILFSSIVSCSNFSLIILGWISFIAAAYSLFIFTTTSHGALSSYLKMSTNLKIREYLNMVIHWIPLNFILLKMDILLLWL